MPTSAVNPELTDALRGASRIALAGHVTPDADCLAVIGSMALALAQLGKTPVPSLPEGSVPPKLAFMRDLIVAPPGDSAAFASCDAALIMDTAKEPRVNIEGKLGAVPNAKILNVDHHASNTRFGDVQWIDATRSSAAEMVYELINALGAEVTPEIATLLYAGIHSDTQGFSLSNTTGRSLEVAHELANAGADIVNTCEKLCRSKSRSEFDLLKIIYGNTQIDPTGALAWSSASFAEMNTAGCSPGDIDDQVEIVRSIEGVRVAILFTEGVAGKVRLNFRGEKKSPVLPLAETFGGGGHNQAAGAILSGTIESAVERVIPKAREYVARLD